MTYIPSSMHSGFSKDVPMKVHNGYLKAYNSVASTLARDYLKKLDDRMDEFSTLNIRISGHSVGAAFAQLAAAQIRAMYPSKDVCDIEIVLWGPPQVGNEKFKDFLLQEVTPKIVRITNGFDFFPMWPNNVFTKGIATAGDKIARGVHAALKPANALDDKVKKQGQIGKLVSKELTKVIKKEGGKIGDKAIEKANGKMKDATDLDVLGEHQSYFVGAKEVAWTHAKFIGNYHDFDKETEFKVRIDEKLSVANKFLYLLRERSDGADFTKVLTTSPHFYHQWSFYANLSESYYFSSPKEQFKKVAVTLLAVTWGLAMFGIHIAGRALPAGGLLGTAVGVIDSFFAKDGGDGKSGSSKSSKTLKDLSNREVADRIVGLLSKRLEAVANSNRHKLEQVMARRDAQKLRNNCLGKICGCSAR